MTGGLFCGIMLGRSSGSAVIAVEDRALFFFVTDITFFIGGYFMQRVGLVSILVKRKDVGSIRHICHFVILEKHFILHGASYVLVIVSVHDFRSHRRELVAIEAAR